MDKSVISIEWKLTMLAKQKDNKTKLVNIYEMWSIHNCLLAEVEFMTGFRSICTFVREADPSTNDINTNAIQYELCTATPYRLYNYCQLILSTSIALPSSLKTSWFASRRGWTRFCGIPVKSSWLYHCGHRGNELYELVDILDNDFRHKNTAILSRLCAHKRIGLTMG